MARILIERPRLISNCYWQHGLFQAIISYFRQIKYLCFFNGVPDLDQAYSEARIDCARDLYKQLIVFGIAVKVWITMLVKYEPVNFITIKQPFKKFLNASLTCMLKRIDTISANLNSYIDFFKFSQIKSERINQTVFSTNPIFNLPEYFNLFQK